jgi:hypothetical protein
MSKFAIRTDQVRSSLHILQEQIAAVQSRIDREASFRRNTGKSEVADALAELGSLVSNFAKHIGTCTEAWDQFAIDAAAKLQEFERNPATSAQSKQNMHNIS